MAKKFGYRGHPWSCLWCGLKFKEGVTVKNIKTMTGTEILLYQVGGKFEVDGYSRKVKKVKFTKEVGNKSVEVQMHEDASQLCIWWDPPRVPDTPLGLVAGLSDDTKTMEPLFCCKGCACEFAVRLAELGKRLRKSEE